MSAGVTPIKSPLELCERVAQLRGELATAEAELILQTGRTFDDWCDGMRRLFEELPAGDDRRDDGDDGPRRRRLTTAGDDPTTS